ncbi:MAG: hypothetical protein U0694_05590 [Anaerolineae bacterium]
MSHDTHLREKAIRLRTDQHMTLEQIVERLQLPKTTVYGWIRHLPIPRTNKQNAAQRKGTHSMQAKYKAQREAAYQQGWAEAPTLLQDATFRDFVVLYMAEGYKRDRNRVSICNSDKLIMQLAQRWLSKLSSRKLVYRIQYHVDQNLDEIKQYWAEAFAIRPEDIGLQRKSNSGKLAGRQFRSVYGVLEISIRDTNLRAKLQSWMDFIKQQW